MGLGVPTELGLRRGPVLGEQLPLEPIQLALDLGQGEGGEPAVGMTEPVEGRRQREVPVLHPLLERVLGVLRAEVVGELAGAPRCSPLASKLRTAARREASPRFRARLISSMASPTTTGGRSPQPTLATIIPECTKSSTSTGISPPIRYELLHPTNSGLVVCGERDQTDADAPGALHDQGSSNRTPERSASVESVSALVAAR